MVEQKKVFQVPVWFNVEGINREDARAMVTAAMTLALETLKENHFSRSYTVLNEHAVGDRLEIFEV